MHDDLAIGVQVTLVDGLGRAAEVPEIIDPEPVDRHGVRSSVGSGRRQPVLGRLLKPRPDILPGQGLRRCPILSRKTDGGRFRHPSPLHRLSMTFEAGWRSYGPATDTF